MVDVPIPEIRGAAQKILSHRGYASNEAERIADVLLYAEMRGNNQGLVKLISDGIAANGAAGTPIITRETPVSALIDARGTHAMIAMTECMAIARKKAENVGLAMVGLHNATPSTGAIGYFVHELARQGLIAVMAAGSPSYVAIHGGRTPTIGTNPLAFGIPGKDSVLVLDMASAAIAYYGVIEAREAGQELPEGVATDAAGQPTRDPVAALGGAIRTFGEHKGSGLGIIVEVLTGPLIQAGFCSLGDDQYGQLLIAIDPEIMCDREIFIDQVESLKTHLKTQPALDGVDEIFLPGERGNNVQAGALARGLVPIDPAIWNKIKTAAQAR